MESHCSTPSSSRSRVVAATASSVPSPSSSRSRGVTASASNAASPRTGQNQNVSLLNSKLPQHLQQPSSSSGSAVHTSMHSVRPGESYVTVQTLTKENLVIVVNQKTRVHDVLWRCGEILEIKEDKLFGLALRQPTDGIGGDQPRHEYFFLDPAQRIAKYAPKQPRFANWHSRSNENRPLLVLYFRVRVYIDQVRLITCSKALEHYYLQLKDNLLDQWASPNSVSEERCWQLATLAIKVDKGDLNGGYFRAEQYFPLWVLHIRGLEYVKRHMPRICEDERNLTRHEAMLSFCLEASRSPFALNCHLYGLRRHKMDSLDNVVLGINAKGIEMCDIGNDGERIPLRSLVWSRVTRLSFDRKKITIVGAEGTKMSLYAQNENKARYLLELCRSVHQTLLVLSHQSARGLPLPPPFHEKSVDSTAHSDDRDTDMSETTERTQTGSVSSKQRLRLKLDPNHELAIEKRELESIRQERAASQSSKGSEERVMVAEVRQERPEKIENKKEKGIEQKMERREREIENETIREIMESSHMENVSRPGSVDSASQTDVVPDENFNSKFSDISLSETLLPLYSHMNILPDLQYTSSTGSRSNSVQHSDETIPDIHYPSYQDQATGLDTESTLRPVVSASMSLHDLRTHKHLETVDDHRGLPSSNQMSMTGNEPSNGISSTQARSEPRIDSDLWCHPSVSAALFDVPTNGGRLFQKRPNSGARGTNSINRVHSMPAHYHLVHTYQRSVRFNY